MTLEFFFCHYSNCHFKINSKLTRPLSLTCTIAGNGLKNLIYILTVIKTLRLDDRIFSPYLMMYQNIMHKGEGIEVNVSSVPKWKGTMLG